MSLSDDLCVAADDVYLKHRAPSAHPECPERLIPLLREFGSIPWLAALPRLKQRSSNERELLRVHAAEMVAALSAARGSKGWFDGDTYFAEPSVDVALLAAGQVIDMTLAVWKKRFRRGFSFVRPPGHHATRESSMGFCLVNNVALAVAALLDEAPQARIAVVDFDLHHGNGTQFLFYDNPNVLFTSSHRFPFYPGTGGLEEVGQGKGRGTTINLPLAQPYGEEVFLPLYTRLVTPVLRTFSPDLILVSAGFDGHSLDPMQGFSLSTENFGQLAELLLSVAEETAQGRIVFVLEGGYHPEALRDSSIRVLEKMRDFPRAPSRLELSPPGHEIVERLTRFHKSYFPELG